MWIVAESVPADRSIVMPLMVSGSAAVSAPLAKVRSAGASWVATTVVPWRSVAVAVREEPVEVVLRIDRG